MATIAAPMVQGLAAIFAFLLLGDAISSLLSLPIPGSVIGMVLLAGVLQAGWLKLQTVKPAADVLLRNMALLFVPPGVGLMLHVDLVASQWLPIVVASVISTFIVLTLVGHVQQRVARS